MENPFIIKAYHSKELFCDREHELQMMLTNCLNHTDMTLISQRRMGKTGLILRLFDELHDVHPEVATIYIDIFATRSLDDFIKVLAQAAMKTFTPIQTIGEKLMTFIKSLRPQFSYDNITGEPQLTFTYQSQQEREHTLGSLLDFLESQDTHVVIAIDEFQQIREYSKVNMEALLRSRVQHCRNLTFIYCGSKKHLMTDIFANEKRPFYSSTIFVGLNPIDEESYAPFIKRLFAAGNKNISDEAIKFILQWTRRHTFYTQMLCHQVFASGNELIAISVVKRACSQILEMNEPVYMQYYQMLTARQWNMLIAVAKEEAVTNVTATHFLSQYKIGAPSTATRIVASLLTKGLLYDEVSLQSGTVITVSDVFFSQWLKAR